MFSHFIHSFTHSTTSYGVVITNRHYSRHWVYNSYQGPCLHTFFFFLVFLVRETNSKWRSKQINTVSSGDDKLTGGNKIANVRVVNTCERGVTLRFVVRKDLNQDHILDIDLTKCEWKNQNTKTFVALPHHVVYGLSSFYLLVLLIPWVLSTWPEMANTRPVLQAMWKKKAGKRAHLYKNVSPWTE